MKRKYRILYYDMDEIYRNCIKTSRWTNNWLLSFSENAFIRQKSLKSLKFAQLLWIICILIIAYFREIRFTDIEYIYDKKTCDI